jgi:hypothetical protein
MSQITTTDIGASTPVSQTVAPCTTEPSALQIVASRMSEIGLIVEVLEEALSDLTERIEELERAA